MTSDQHRPLGRPDGDASAPARARGRRLARRASPRCPRVVAAAPSRSSAAAAPSRSARARGAPSRGSRSQYVTVGAGRVALVDRRAGRPGGRPARRRRRDRASQRTRRRRRLGRSAARAFPPSTRQRPEPHGALARRLRDARGALRMARGDHAVSTTFPLRDDLRGMTPYGAPQAALPVALNVNENTHPVPEDVADDIVDCRRAGAARREPLPRPRVHRSCARRFADYLGHGLTREQIWAANGSNEVLQHVLQAFGGPGRTALRLRADLLDVPAARRAARARAGSPAARAADFTLVARDAAVAGDRAPRSRRRASSARRTTRPARRCRSTSIEAVVRRRPTGIVVVDEAYQEFAPPASRSALDAARRAASACSSPAR